MDGSRRLSRFRYVVASSSSGGVGLLRSHISANVLLWVNRSAGAILVIFGLLAIGRAFVA